MCKAISKIRFHWHTFWHKHNKALVKDAHCEVLKAKLIEKARYHCSKAIRLQTEIRSQS